MESETRFAFVYHSAFKVDAEQLQANEPEWCCDECFGKMYISKDDFVCLTTGDSFRSLECRRKQMEEFVEVIKRYPAEPTGLEETLKVVYVHQSMKFQDCGVPFIRLPDLFDSVSALQDPEESTVYSLNNVRIVVHGPYRHGKAIVIMHASVQNHPDIDQNWRSIMQNAKKTLLAAVSTPVVFGGDEWD